MSEKEPVAMIADPFGLNTLDVLADQESEEELELNTPEEAAEQLENVAQAIREAEVLQAASAESETEESAQALALKLAAQIAEDQELAAELALQAEQELNEEEDLELQAALPKLPEALDGQALDLSEIQSCMEALLFISDKPLSLAKLQDLLGPDFPTPLFEQALADLVARYQLNHHGIELLEIAGGYQFRTRPGRSALARKLAKVQTQRLSSGGMETLAIIAYKQPVLKDDIDKIRGVDSSYFVRGLLDKKLIAISGRSDLPGRPMLYTTTDEFLQIFGLADLSAMPPLQELERMVPVSQVSKEEDPRVREMRKLVGEMNSDTSISLKYDPLEDEKILREIKEQISAIPTSTPYLEEQKALDKAESTSAQSSGQA